MTDKENGTNEDGTKLEFKKIDEYVAGVSGSGKRTKNNGDAIATTLNGMTLEEVTQLASRMKIEHRDYGAEREDGTILNVGMQRMNIGNIIRGAVNKLEKAEEGTGYDLLDSKSKGLRTAVNKRSAAADKAAEKAAADKAARAEEKAEAEAA